MAHQDVMWRAPWLLLAVMFACVAIVASATAHGEASAPIGHWASADSVDVLVVEQRGYCSFLHQGQVVVTGSCTWYPSANGGILDITYPMPVEPGHVRYSIVWISRTKITIFGQPFFKQ